MTKPMTVWCVVNKSGYLCYKTMADKKTECIAEARFYYGMDYSSRGFHVRKFLLQEKQS